MTHVHRRRIVRLMEALDAPGNGPLQVSNLRSALLDSLFHTPIDAQAVCEKFVPINRPISDYSRQTLKVFAELLDRDPSHQAAKYFIEVEAL